MCCFYTKALMMFVLKCYTVKVSLTELKFCLIILDISHYNKLHHCQINHTLLQHSIFGVTRSDSSMNCATVVKLHLFVFQKMRVAPTMSVSSANFPPWKSEVDIFKLASYVWFFMCHQFLIVYVPFKPNPASSTFLSAGDVHQSDPPKTSKSYCCKVTQYWQTITAALT